MRATRTKYEIEQYAGYSLNLNGNLFCFLSPSGPLRGFVFEICYYLGFNRCNNFSAVCIIVQL